ncbi:MAG: class beta-lactamase [Rhizobacter sp.]|nr:class beta-lactamase [Rhizobacter sp.]
MMNRRTFGAMAGLLAMGVAGPLEARQQTRIALREHCRNVEAEIGGRLGASVMDTMTGRIESHRADERFPICSTFKWLAAAALLDRVDAGGERLDRRIRFEQADLLEWAPVTKQRVGGDGMSLAELAQAAVAQSDNTAGNLIVRETGGTAGFNRFLRSIGDAQTRLDRGEPELNEALVGDLRDTTTPAAAVADLRRLLLEDALSPSSREQLKTWMLATQTSDKRLRADLPSGWRLADKTGTGNSGTGTASDVGVYWPEAGKPIVVAVYMTRVTVSRERQEAVIADIGRWARADRTHT